MATQKVTPSWGKCDVYVKNLTTNTWAKFATPVQDSTQFTTNQGESVPAPIEGGTNEAVRYNANTYQLTFDIRQVPERTDPIVDVDGVVLEEYSVMIIPENPAAKGVLVHRAAVNVQTNFNASDGITKTYTFDTLKPVSGPQVELVKDPKPPKTA